jgi:hypothetical protein
MGRTPGLSAPFDASTMKFDRESRARRDRGQGDFLGWNLIIDAVRQSMLLATEIQPLFMPCDSFQVA